MIINNYFALKTKQKLPKVHLFLQGVEILLFII